MEQPQAEIITEINPETGLEEQRIIPPSSPEHSAKRMLSVEDILTAEDVLESEINIPEWGGWITVRQFSKREEQELRQQARDDATGEIDRDYLEMLIIIHGIISPRFTIEHVEALRDKSQSSLDKVLKKLTALNGGTEEAVAEAEKRFPA